MVLSGREKATIFLSILGAETAARVLRYLPEELADLIAAGINHLPTPSPEALADVMGEFKSYLSLPEPTRPAELEEAPEPNRPSPPTKPYGVLVYERPQLAAFILSLLTEEELPEAFRALARDKTLIEELLQTQRVTPLHDKMAEQLQGVYAGKLF